MKKLTRLPAGKILPIAVLISLIFFAGSVNAQNNEVCYEKLQSIQDKCDISFEECNNPCKSLIGTAWGSCYTACRRADYDCYQKSVSPYNECLEKEINCEEAGKIKGSKDCEKVQDRKGESSIKQSNSSKNGNPFNIFAINPFEAWLKLKAVSDIPQLFEDVYVDIFYEHALWGPGALEQLTIADIYGGTLGSQFPTDLEPAITVKDEEEAWAFLPNFVFPDKENITVVKGQGQLKPSNGTYFDSIFTGNTSEMVTFRYTWGTKSGAVVNVAPKTEIKILKPTQDKETRDIIRQIKLNKGELEIRVKNTNPENKFGVQTETLDLIVIGTHFWVSHDPGKKQTMVAVYEGKVEVKTNDGKTTTVNPDRDPSASSGQGKPGVVVVVQKLSIIKLVFAGLALIAVIGGAAFFLKRRKDKTFRSKKIR